MDGETSIAEHHDVAEEIPPYRPPPEDLTYPLVLLRAGLGCGGTLSAGVFATFAGFVVVQFLVEDPRDFEYRWWLTVLWVGVAVAALVGAAVAVMSPRVGKSLERSMKTSWLGCLVPLVMVVVGTVGTFVVPAVGEVHTTPGANVGQGIGIGLLLYCFVTPAAGIVAVFHPRLGVAFGTVMLVGWLVSVFQAYH